MNSLKGKRILFANVPGEGHFNPLTGLAKHLAAQGCDVRWYSSYAFAGKIAQLGIQHYPFTRALDVPSDKIDEVFPERKTIKGQIAKLNFDMRHYFILRGPEYLEDMKDIYSDWPFDVLVADCVFSAIPFVEPVLGVPVISIGVLPLVETSKDLAPSGLGITPSRNFLGRFKQTLLRKMADHVLFKKSNRLFFSLLAKYNIEPTTSNAFDALVKGARYFLQSGTPGMEYKRSDMGSNIHFIGPVLPYSDPGKPKRTWAPPDWKKWRGAILVTQGTVEKDVEKLLVPTLDAFKGTDILVIATTGGSGTDNLRKRFPHENIIVEDFIPFNEVMPHVQAMVSNGGFGGVLMGIQHRLPLVVAGIHEGKNEICARIGYFRLGINLQTEQPQPKQVKKAVEQVLQEPVYRNNITVLSNEFAAYPVNQRFEQFLLRCLKEVPAGSRNTAAPVAA